MIDISFPDGVSKKFEEGTSPFEIASSISSGLARNIISASFNNNVVELTSKISESGKINFFFLE